MPSNKEVGEEVRDVLVHVNGQIAASIESLRGCTLSKDDAGWITTLAKKLIGTTQVLITVAENTCIPGMESKNE